MFFMILVMKIKMVIHDSNHGVAIWNKSRYHLDAKEANNVKQVSRGNSLSQRRHDIPGKQSWGRAMRSRSFGTLMSSVDEDNSVRLAVSPLGNTSAAWSRLFCKQTQDAVSISVCDKWQIPATCDLVRPVIYARGVWLTNIIIIIIIGSIYLTMSKL